MQLFFMEASGLELDNVSTTKIVNLFYHNKVLYLLLVAKFSAIKTTQPEIM